MSTYHLKHDLEATGPRSRLAVCSFTTADTAAVTTNEAQGCTFARTGVGTFVVTFDNTPKAMTVGMSVQFSTTAQLAYISARDLTARTLTIKTVTAGGSTAVDTTGMRIDIVAKLRLYN